MSENKDNYKKMIYDGIKFYKASQKIYECQDESFKDYTRVASKIPESVINANLFIHEALVAIIPKGCHLAQKDGQFLGAVFSNTNQLVGQARFEKLIPKGLDIVAIVMTAMALVSGEYFRCKIAKDYSKIQESLASLQIENYERIVRELQTDTDDINKIIDLLENHEHNSNDISVLTAISRRTRDNIGYVINLFMRTKIVLKKDSIPDIGTKTSCLLTYKELMDAMWVLYGMSEFLVLMCETNDTRVDILTDRTLSSLKQCKEEINIARDNKTLELCHILYGKELGKSALKAAFWNKENLRALLGPMNTVSVGVEIKNNTDSNIKLVKKYIDDAIVDLQRESEMPSPIEYIENLNKAQVFIKRGDEYFLVFVDDINSFMEEFDISEEIPVEEI